MIWNARRFDRQLALALRDEVLDPERAGLKIIQIDEAALREGLPLRKEEAEKYLRWAIGAFRLTVSGVGDTTQIHTHMCYSEFNAILKWIAAMDANVISIEASRSDMESAASLCGLQISECHRPRRLRHPQPPRSKPRRNAGTPRTGLCDSSLRKSSG